MEDGFKKKLEEMQQAQIEAQKKAKELYEQQIKAKEAEVPPPVPVDPKVIEMEQKMQELSQQLKMKDENLNQLQGEN